MNKTSATVLLDARDSTAGYSSLGGEHGERITLVNDLLGNRLRRRPGGPSLTKAYPSRRE
jgi:hypothetical protein